jgi:hypothetical protein
MPRIDLVVTDLDGTLWHTDDDVPPGIAAAWAEVTSRVPVLVATGRRLTSTRGPLGRIGVAPPAVVLNGALVLDLATGERYHRAPFPAEQAVAVLAAFRSVGLSPCLYVDPGAEGPEVLVGEVPSTNPGHLRSMGEGVGVADLDEVVAHELVLAFSIIGGPHGPLAEASDAMAGTAEVHLDRALDYPGMASLTVAPRGQSKWDGVLAHCARHGLDPAHVLAVADGPNDLELLTGAAVRVVPEVAHPAARALATHTIPAAREGGWTALPDLLDELAAGEAGRR